LMRQYDANFDLWLLSGCNILVGHFKTKRSGGMDRGMGRPSHNFFYFPKATR
jgi:hypothetical protein